MPEGIVRVGLIGCGGIAPAHLDAYQLNEKARVVGVMDVDESRAAALAKSAGATPYTDYLQMIEKERLDAVSLLTPPSSHREIAEHVLAAGVHLFAEKPLAWTAAEGQAMAEAARRAGKLLMVAQCHRFHEPVRRAKALIENGDLGALSTYRNRFGYLRGTPDALTRGRGGVLLDNGSHSSYLFRYLMGPVARVFAWAPAAQRSRIDDLCVCTLLLETAAGTAGVVELDGAMKTGPNAIEIHGDKGSAIINYGGTCEFRPAGGAPVSLEDPSLPGGHRFEREINHFIACVLGEEEPEIGAEEGVADLRVLEAAFESIRSGRAVPVAA